MSQLKTYLLLIVCLASASVAGAQACVPGEDESWNASSQNVTSNVNPFRTTESHIKSGDRSVDKKTVEVLGPAGQYQPYFELVTETIQESPTVTRCITRKYNPDSDGHEQLTQITEAETQISDGVTRIVQTMSTNNIDEKFHVAERKIMITTKGSDSQRTQTTVYMPINGELAATVKINEQQTNGANGRVDTKKETLLSDTLGGWQLYEVREQTATGDTGNRTTDERVSRRDYEGKVSPVSEVITKDTNVNGQHATATENYSVDVPGRARDQSLHLLQTSKNVQTTEPGRIITEQQVIQPGSFDKNLDTQVNRKDVVIQDSNGSDETITVTARYPDGYPSVVTVETRQIKKR